MSTFALENLLRFRASVSQPIRKASRTHVILLHEGQPRSAFYAKEFLAKSAQAFYNLPRTWKFVLPSWLVPRKVHICVEEYGRRGEIHDTTLTHLENDLRNALDKLIPELSPFCISSAALHEKPSISETIKRSLRENPRQIVFLPLSPHFSCMSSGLLLNEAARILYQDTISAPGAEGRRILPKTEVSTLVSAVHRWGQHPLISNHWCAELAILRGKIEGILFVAPATRGPSSSEYRRSVWASCERIMWESRLVLPARLAFFNSWQQWDLPLPESIERQMRHLKDARMAVVPITSIVPSFDTISIIPREMAKYQNTILLEPKSSLVLIQGMAEIIRNHLFGRRSAQLQLYCNGCRRKDCQLTRLIMTH